MKKFHIDLATNKEISKREAEEKSYLVGFCSWRRLTTVFVAAKELKSNERIVALDLDENGITMRIDLCES